MATLQSLPHGLVHPTLHSDALAAVPVHLGILFLSPSRYIGSRSGNQDRSSQSLAGGPKMPLSRRDFARISALGLAAHWTPHAFAQPTTAEPRRIGYAVIGLGRIAAHFTGWHRRLRPLEDHGPRQRPPRQGRAHRGAVQRSRHLHLLLRGLRPHRRQPRRRRRLRRSPQQHACRIHHPRRACWQGTSSARKPMDVTSAPSAAA